MQSSNASLAVNHQGQFPVVTLSFNLAPGVSLGDATKARKALNWQPKVKFDELIDMMVASDLEIAKKEKTLLDAGYACGNNRRI